MKVKIVKNLGNISWDKYIGRIFDAVRDIRSGGYFIRLEKSQYETEWLEEEVEEVK